MLRCAAMESSIPQRVFAGVVIPSVCAVLVLAYAAPATAQAKGSAEAAAAKRVDPHWKVPRTAWGHPDLEGIWTTDDMRGVPMARPQQFGNRLYMTDEEFAARSKQRRNARDVDDARTGTFRNEEGSRDFSYTSMVIDPPDGRDLDQAFRLQRAGALAHELAADALAHAQSRRLLGIGFHKPGSGEFRSALQSRFTTRFTTIPRHCPCPIS